jgi:hypothetical protein
MNKVDFKACIGKVINATQVVESRNARSKVIVVIEGHLHWDSLPITLLQGLSYWLTGALSCRGPLEWVVAHLSGLSH